MAKREAAPPDLQWESADESDGADDSGAEFQGTATGSGARPGFHLLAARRIEEALEQRQLRKALEDFDDYDV